MKRRVLLNGLLVLIFFTAGSHNCFSQDIPEKPVPPRLVNDFCGLLSTGEANSLERKLVVFNDSTSTQIAIVIVKDLNGYAKADYAQRLGEKWGIGGKGLNNGLLILIKPTTRNSKGEVQISTGYGLEGAIPDLACADIVDNEILPAFRQGDYYGGLDKATTTIMALARGEYTYKYGKSISKYSKQVIKAAPIAVFIIILIIIMILKNSGRSNHSNISRSGLPFWLLLGMMNSGRGSHSGSWGGFSGGSGGGGGFGGFGGGSFGGGGAGGSW
jgi:uncharacterized protein